MIIQVLLTSHNLIVSNLGDEVTEEKMGIEEKVGVNEITRVYFYSYVITTPGLEKCSCAVVGREFLPR